MRGKLFCVLQHFRRHRITPAHAGKTLNLPIQMTNAQDHPRACGENYKTFRELFGRRGSPPRMRGKPHEEITSCYAKRITPAHAGKTR